MDGKNAKALIGRGIAWQGKADDTKAIADFNEAIRLDAKDKYAFVNRAWIYSRKGDYDKAIADYTAAAKAGAEGCRQLFRTGILLPQQGRL